MNIDDIEEVGEKRSLKAQVTLPVVIDMGMIVALVSLSVWIGRQADRLDQLAATSVEIRAEISNVQRSTNSIDIAALKERSIAQDHELLEMREFLGKRLDRIEAKLDHGR